MSGGSAGVHDPNSTGLALSEAPMMRRLRRGLRWSCAYGGDPHQRPSSGTKRNRTPALRASRLFRRHQSLPGLGFVGGGFELHVLSGAVEVAEACALNHKRWLFGSSGLVVADDFVGALLKRFVVKSGCHLITVAPSRRLAGAASTARAMGSVGIVVGACASALVANAEIQSTNRAIRFIQILQLDIP